MKIPLELPDFSTYVNVLFVLSLSFTYFGYERFLQHDLHKFSSIIGIHFICIHLQYIMITLTVGSWHRHGTHLFSSLTPPPNLATSSSRSPSHLPTCCRTYLHYDDTVLWYIKAFNTVNILIPLFFMLSISQLKLVIPNVTEIYNLRMEMAMNENWQHGKWWGSFSKYRKILSSFTGNPTFGNTSKGNEISTKSIWDIHGMALDFSQGDVLSEWGTPGVPSINRVRGRDALECRCQEAWFTKKRQSRQSRQTAAGQNTACRVSRGWYPQAQFSSRVCC